MKGGQNYVYINLFDYAVDRWCYITTCRIDKIRDTYRRYHCSCDGNKIYCEVDSKKENKNRIY